MLNCSEHDGHTADDFDLDGDRLDGPTPHRKSSAMLAACKSMLIV
jgi:hypothetical protein